MPKKKKFWKSRGLAAPEAGGQSPQFLGAASSSRPRRRAALLVCFGLAFYCNAAAFAQDAENLETLSADELYRRGLEAQRSQYWERVIQCWTLGETRFPADARFSESLGDVYSVRELFRLAKEAYQKAERLKPVDVGLLYKLAQTTGSLNEDALAARYLERLLALAPDDREAITLLGWMYFKLHRLEEADSLISSALERIGPGPDLLMMRGTISSDLLRYEQSSGAYEEAILLSLQAGDTDFASVVNYNYSILESRFYQFNGAQARATQALELAARASGHLARGELLLRRLDWKGGLAEYQAAFDMDRSPLSKLSLADTYRACGRLDEARVYAEDCLKRSNHAWMLNYGIDINQYKRDIHEILAKVYAGLDHTQRFTPARHPLEAVASLWKQVRYRTQSAWHQKLYQKYALASANEFGRQQDGGRAFEALMQYYKAFGDSRARALPYLRGARAAEVAAIPQATPVHNFYEGALVKDAALLNTALAGFDGVWEKDMIAEALTTLSKLRNTAEYAEELYVINPGALRQNGIRLPVSFELTGASAAGMAAARLSAPLARCGFKPRKKGARFIVRVSLEDDMAFYELFDTARGFALVRDTLLLPAAAQKSATLCARALADAFFTVPKL